MSKDTQWLRDTREKMANDDKAATGHSHSKERKKEKKDSRQRPYNFYKK